MLSPPFFILKKKFYFHFGLQSLRRRKKYLKGESFILPVAAVKAYGGAQARKECEGILPYVVAINPSTTIGASRAQNWSGVMCVIFHWNTYEIDIFLCPSKVMQAEWMSSKK